MTAVAVVEDLEALWELIEDDNGATAVFAFNDAGGDPVLVFCDEDGGVCYQRVPVDDPDDHPIGYLDNGRVPFPLTRLVPAS